MPQKWTDNCIAQLTDYSARGWSNAQIAAVMGRSEISIQIKRKRLQKTGDRYNDRHRHLKYLSNQKYLDVVKPRSVLDVYAGNSWYEGKVKTLVTNDVDTKFTTDYHMDAFKLLCKLYSEDKRYDVVDLDPYGSAVDCFGLALKLARKGVVITLGEMGHKRWKRTDWVERWYGIDSADNINPRTLIEGLNRIAAAHKRHLTCLHVDTFTNLARAYFTLDELKITKQWDGEATTTIPDITIDDLHQSSLF